MTIHQIKVPKGRLGLLLEKKSENGHVIVCEIDDDSPVKDLFQIGDIITRIDEVDIDMDVDLVCNLLRKRTNLDRNITIKRMNSTEGLRTDQQANQHSGVNPTEAENENTLQGNLTKDSEVSKVMTCTPPVESVKEQSAGDTSLSLNVSDIKDAEAGLNPKSHGESSTTDRDTSLDQYSHLNPSTNGTEYASYLYGPSEIIEAPPGRLAITVAKERLKDKCILKIIKIEWSSPLRDMLKLNDLITHINNTEISGDIDVFREILSNTKNTTRSLRVRRSLQPRTSINSSITSDSADVRKGDKVRESSIVPATFSPEKKNGLDKFNIHSTEHSDKSQISSVVRPFAFPGSRKYDALSDNFVSKVIHYMETYTPGCSRKENGDFVPLTFVSVPNFGLTKTNGSFGGIDVILVKDIARSILGFLVTKIHDFSPLCGQLYPGHLITRLNSVHVDETSSFEKFYMEYCSDNDNVLEAEHLPLRQLVSFHSGEPITKQHIDPTISVFAKMPQEKALGLLLQTHRSGFLVLDVGPTSIFLGKIFKNDIILSYHIGVQQFSKSVQSIKSGDILQMCITIPLKDGCSNHIDVQRFKDDKKEKDMILGPIRTVKFTYSGKYLGLVLVQRLDLGGFLVLSKSKECKVNVCLGDVLIKFNKSLLQGRSIFDLVSLIEKTDERHQTFTVRAYKQFNHSSGAEGKDNAFAPSSASNHSSFGKMKTVVLPSNPIEIECKRYDSSGVIVSNIDYEGSQLSGINRGDLIQKLDGHSTNTLGLDKLDHMIIAASREAMIELCPTHENEESSLPKDKESEIQQESANNEAAVKLVDAMADDKPNFIVQTQSPDEVSAEIFESMPICYSYIVGDSISEKVANFRSKFMNTKKRKRNQTQGTQSKTAKKTSSRANDNFVDENGELSSIPKSIIISRNNPKFLKEEDLGGVYFEGWKKHHHKRFTGKHIDYYYFTKTGIKLRSRLEANRFAELLKETNGDEAAALKLFENKSH